MYDVAVIGGGVMGSTIALHLSRGGMRTTILERRGLAMEASGVNAGTLTHQVSPYSIIPYHRRAIELWSTASEWLSRDFLFHRRGGLTIAFNEHESALLRSELNERVAAGAPIDLVNGNRARAIEPVLSANVDSAFYSALDGYANASVTGRAYREALSEAGVHLRESTQVSGVSRQNGGFTVHSAGDDVHATRVVIASGVWVRHLVESLGLVCRQQVECRVNQMMVTERMGCDLQAILTCARGGLTLKRADNGTILVGGGWQGLGTPARGGHSIIPENVVGNLRLAQYAVPDIKGGRVVRSWLGLEARFGDQAPVAGPLPKLTGAYVVGGFFSGWTVAPYIGWLVAQQLLGHEPERPLFDPGRVFD